MDGTGGKLRFTTSTTRGFLTSLYEIKKQNSFKLFGPVLKLNEIVNSVQRWEMSYKKSMMIHNVLGQMKP